MHSSPYPNVHSDDPGELSTDPNNPFSEPSTFIDPLVDGAACQRDIPFLQRLGVNAVRVYSVDSAGNHDTCMNALSQAGIYTMCVLRRPVHSIKVRSAHTGYCSASTSHSL